MRSLPTHPYCAACESPLALSVTYWLWLCWSRGQNVLGRASLPPCCFSSSLFARSSAKRERIRTEEDSLMLRSFFFFSKVSFLFLYFTICDAASQKHHLLVCTNPAASRVFSEHIAAHTHCTDCAYDICRQQHPHSCTHHLHTHTQHPAYWRVTMETQRLPNRGCDGGSRGERTGGRVFTSIHPCCMNQSVAQEHWTLFFIYVEC